MPDTHLDPIDDYHDLGQRFINGAECGSYGSATILAVRGGTVLVVNGQMVVARRSRGGQIRVYMSWTEDAVAHRVLHATGVLDHPTASENHERMIDMRERRI